MWGTALAVGALALLGIGGAVLAVQYVRRQDVAKSISTSATQALKDGLQSGVKDALTGTITKFFPPAPSSSSGVSQVLQAGNLVKGLGDTALGLGKAFGGSGSGSGSASGVGDGAKALLQTPYDPKPSDFDPNLADVVVD